MPPTARFESELGAIIDDTTADLCRFGGRIQGRRTTHATLEAARAKT